MTTPEKMKERQERILKWLRIEGWLLGFVLIVVGLSQAWYSYENSQQDRCVENQITALTQALDARSVASRELNEATADVIDAFANAGAQARKNPNRTEAEQQRDSEPILEALENYTKVKSEVRREQDRNPFPPFPKGTCE
jgi:hypothetical protein